MLRFDASGISFARGRTVHKDIMHIVLADPPAASGFTETNKKTRPLVMATTMWLIMHACVLLIPGNSSVPGRSSFVIYRSVLDQLHQ